MLAIFDDSTSSKRLLFDNPRALIVANTLSEVLPAFIAIEEALACGDYVAGWFSYELGYALESKLHPLLPAHNALPLIKLGVYRAATREAPAPSGRAYAGPLVHEWQRSIYGEAFERVRGFIAAGDIYQANLSFRARFAFAGDPYAFYENLRAKSAAAYCAYIDDDLRQILSLSPELFFEIAPDGTIKARPMKGTSPRRHDDAAERRALAASAKDRAENLMIVDLIRNDLSRIAQIGSVRVEDLFKVETYPNLHTMVSTVVAQKAPDASIAGVVRALFPCGSVTGAPKIRAMEILEELEDSPRGIYCGAIGYFAPDRSARFNVAIRTITIASGHGELGVGGGVVQDSHIESEYAECLLKTGFFEAGRRKLELIETLRFENDFVRLDSHLERMRNSARVFGLTYDDATARRALRDAVAGKQGPLRARITLDEAGLHKATAVSLAPNPPRWIYAFSPCPVCSSDILQRHKTNWRDLYEQELARIGTNEVVFLNERGEVVEGSYSNIFVKRDGVLWTPPLEAGALDGRLRAELIDLGRAREATLLPDDLSGEIFFGNSLRGLIPAVRLQP